MAGFTLDSIHTILPGIHGLKLLQPTVTVPRVDLLILHVQALGHLPATAATQVTFWTTQRGLHRLLAQVMAPSTTQSPIQAAGITCLLLVAVPKKRTKHFTMRVGVAMRAPLVT